jgi:ATPase subunit of ABC transporter with duplicated ATPase domains
MPYVICNGLAYAHPGGDLLFRDVSFRVAAGAKVGVVGANGIGKSTLFGVLTGALAAEQGEATVGGRCAYMTQDVGVAGEARTVHELLLALAPGGLRSAGERMAAAERRLAGGDDDAGMDLATAIGDWSELGGYELQGQWDAACRRIVRSSFAALSERPAASLSGGERKRLVLDLLFASDADVLLLDEPDNFLDVPAKRALEQQIAGSKKTVVVISHDRELLSAAVSAILTVEGDGAWMHQGSYATYPQARAERQRKLGDAVRRWKEEERRLFALMKTFKERARYNSDWAKKADAAQTRWQRFADGGPPPAPVVDQQIRVRMRGADSARKALVLERVGVDGLVRSFSDEVHLGERVGLVGPNGGGKTRLIRALAGQRDAHSGEIRIGNRVSVGSFTQLNVRGDFAGRRVVDIVVERVGAIERALGALARYGLADAAQRSHDVLSGGQKARLEILCLELEGHNLLLLDEPTDNLDIDSCEALEAALDGFEGTVVAVSHDRAFLKRMDRFLMVLHDGTVLALPDYDSASQALRDPDRAAAVRLAKRLTNDDRGWPQDLAHPVRGEAPDLSDDGSGHRVHPTLVAREREGNPPLG